MGVLTTSLFRRLRAFPRAPRKLQKLRDSIKDLRWWALTVRSRWSLAAFKGPIIAITGAKGKTTTTGLVSRIFKDAGYKVALKRLPSSRARRYSLAVWSRLTPLTWWRRSLPPKRFAHSSRFRGNRL
jgi:hypothetical protein